MSTHNIGFYDDLTKISFNYHQNSSNTHLISSSGLSHPNGMLVFNSLRPSPCSNRVQNLCLVMRKPVFAVFDQVPHKLGCTTAIDD